MIDTTKILSDEQELRERENQLKNISIPVEVNQHQFAKTKPSV